MEAIDRLAHRVERAWSDVGFDEPAFAGLAAAELDAWMREDEPPTFDALLGWAARAPRQAAQVELDSLFSDLPLTLVARDRFFIEALVWLDGTTTIHEHAFAGAFTVLGGSSLHATYAFAPAGPSTSELKLGQLSLKTVEVLRRGDVRSIVVGPSFIHSLFHLDHPSVSLVVRTYGAQANLPQLNYWPGLAASREQRTSAERRRRGVFGLMCDLGHADAIPAGQDAVRNGDLRLTFDLMMRCAAAPRGPEVMNALADEASARFSAAWVNAMRLAWREKRRLINIAGRRRAVKDPSLRLFLAILLNLPSRRAVLECTAALFDGIDPVDRVVMWIAELAAAPSPDVAALGPNLLGVDLPPGWEPVARRLLRGDPSDAPGLDELKTQMILEHSQLLGPCFGE